MTTMDHCIEHDPRGELEEFEIVFHGTDEVRTILARSVVEALLPINREVPNLAERKCSIRGRILMIHSADWDTSAQP